MTVQEINNKSQIQSLQFFRGLAAIAVVFHHAILSTEGFIGNVPNWIHKTLGLGNFGVDFFFVLSGFIIMHIHQADNRTFRDSKIYLYKRLTRVYPVYWPIAVILGLAYFLIPSMSAVERNISFISSIFLIPMDGKPGLSVAWTLIHEVIFYSVFLLYFISSKVFYTALAIWALVITLVQFISFESGWYSYFFSILNLEFMMGVIAVKSIKHVKKNNLGKVFSIIGVVIAVIALIYLSDVGTNYLRLIFAFGMSLLMIGFIDMEERIKIRWSALLLLLGNASYSIYLIHNPLLSLTQRLFAKLHFDWYSALISGAVISIFFGVTYHLIVEKKLIKITKYFGRILFYSQKNRQIKHSNFIR